MRPTSRFTDLTKGLAALIATAGLVLGVPAGLWTQVGWPLPSALPTWSEFVSTLRSGYLSDQVLIDVLAVVCWVAWAQLVVALVAETVAAREGRSVARRLPVARPLRDTAAQLVATITLLGSLVGPRTAVAAAVTIPDVAVTAPEHPEAPVEQPVQAPLSCQYVVQPRDDLWSLAERHLGDPYRWPEVYALNHGRPQHDGGALDDPELLRPGWKLEFPPDAVGLPDAAAPTETPADHQPPPASSQGYERPPAAPAPDPRPAHPAPVPPAPDLPDRGAGLSESSKRETAPARPAPTTNHGSPRVGPLIELPTGQLVGAALASGVATALAAARLHTRRRRRPSAPQPGIRHAEALATDIVSRLRRAVASPSEDAGSLEPLTPQAPPGTVTAADAQGLPVLFDLTTLGGLTLTGPGAEAAARGLLVDLLASPTPGTTQVLLADPTGRLLLGTAPFPGLEVSDLAGALSRLEVEVLARTRLLDTAELPNWRTLLHHNPADPVPALVLIAAGPDPSLLRRLDTVAGLGRRLGLGILLLGDDLDTSGAAVTVDASGAVTQMDGRSDDLAAARLPALTPEDADDLLAVLAAGRDTSTWEEQPALYEPPAEPFPVPAVDEGGKAISVTLFGPYDIEAGGAPLHSGLRNKARELLALLLLHPRGITLEQATAALWPDADPARGTERFRTVLGNLRSRLRAAADLPAAAIVEHLGSQRYQADAELFDCDLWRFQHALGRAADAKEDHAQIAALEAAAAAYTGELLDGALYDWVEPAREDLRRRALDALALLATHHQKAGDTAAALATLEQAITHDPYAESLYQRIIRLQAALGQPDAARRTYRLLEARLAELDTDPEPATTALLTNLLSGAAPGLEHSR